MYLYVYYMYTYPDLDYTYFQEKILQRPKVVVEVTDQEAM